MSWTQAEYECKLAKIRELMDHSKIERILVTSGINFFWLTGGRPFINTAVEKACASLLITPEKVYLIANNIEINRLLEEELAGLDILPAAYSWYDAAGMQNILSHASSGKPWVADCQVETELAHIRWELLPGEIDRYKDACSSASLALEQVAGAVQPGMTERQAAYLIKAKAWERGVSADVALVAADGRAFSRRHPLPTDKGIDRYVMLVISGRKHGLYASVTRLVYFGKAPEELKLKQQAVAQVDAAFILSSVPGATVGEVFQAGMAAYEKAGFPGEWRMHHQGGLAGYNSREFRAYADHTYEINKGQVYAWNPSIAGVKSEDTILVTDGKPEVLTQTENYPYITVRYNGWTIARPDIWER